MIEVLNNKSENTPIQNTVIDFYSNVFENKLINAVKGTELFNKIVYSQIPSVFIGSAESGIEICKSILLENGFKNIELLNIDDLERIFSIIEQKQASKYFIVINDAIDLKNKQIQLCLFYILEVIKRNDLSLNFIIDNSTMITSPIPDEINSRLFELNTIFLKTPTINDITIILQNLQSINPNFVNPKAFEIIRDYTKIKDIILAR